MRPGERPNPSHNRLYAELHLHLGGAILPRILYEHLKSRHHPLIQERPDYASFERYFTEPRASLNEYLELHKLIERVQDLDNVAYFVERLVRGAYLFESLCYIELRYTPYFRTSPGRPEHIRIAQMRDVVETVGKAARAHRDEYPILLWQILCMHSTLPEATNRAIIDLAAEMPHEVCGVDIAGPDTLYREKLAEIVGLLEYAKEKGLKLTAHVFETPEDCHPELLPYLDRIGHGIQIPLRHPELLPKVAERKQCLEICPTSYLKTGTLKDLAELRRVFELCEDHGVDVTVCTDNAGLHMLRLPFEYENLMIHGVINFRQMQAYKDAAFRHAFRWPYRDPPRFLERLEI